MTMSELAIRDAIRKRGPIDQELEEKINWVFSDSKTLDEVNIKSLAKLQLYVLCRINFGFTKNSPAFTC
jgi:hypothetical protein